MSGFSSEFVSPTDIGMFQNWPGERGGRGEGEGERERAATVAGSGEEGPGDAGHAALPGETAGGRHGATPEEERDTAQAHGGGGQVQ